MKDTWRIIDARNKLQWEGKTYAVIGAVEEHFEVVEDPEADGAEEEKCTCGSGEGAKEVNDKVPISNVPKVLAHGDVRSARYWQGLPKLGECMMTGFDCCECHSWLCQGSHLSFISGPTTITQGYKDAPWAQVGWARRHAVSQSISMFIIALCWIWSGFRLRGLKLLVSCFMQGSMRLMVCLPSSFLLRSTVVLT